LPAGCHLEQAVCWVQDKEAQLKAEKQAQLACQPMPAGSSHERPKAAQKQAAAEKVKKATSKELQQAEVLVGLT
jgi:hypothetical protein